MMLHFLAEKSAGDGAAVMVDEFFRGKWGCCDGPGAARVVVMCDVRAWWMDGVRGKGYK
jgi:hypothetical protein